MRKTIRNSEIQHQSESVQGWLNLETLAQVELTSEDPAHPIEKALAPDFEGGWRAAGSGEQTIRILFDEPRTIRHIHIEFRETERSRTQEFVLRWSQDGKAFSEIVRQQYNFSPSGTIVEVEDYRVELEHLTVLELQIRPDVGGGDVIASLQRLLLT